METTARCGVPLLIFFLLNNHSFLRVFCFMRLRPILLGSLVLSVLCMAGPGAARAEPSGVYLSGYMGLRTFPRRDFSDNTTPSSGTVETKNGLAFGGALGFRLSPRIRLEGELSYSNADMDSVSVGGTVANLGGEFKSYILMFSGYYDLANLDWPVTPFVGAGIGLGFHDGEIVDSTGLTATQSGDAWNFVYQIGGGVKYPFGNDMSLVSSYRYLGGTDIGIGGTDIEYSAHEFRMGLEYDLPVGWDLGF